MHSMPKLCLYSDRACDAIPCLLSQTWQRRFLKDKAERLRPPFLNFEARIRCLAARANVSITVPRPAQIRFTSDTINTSPTRSFGKGGRLPREVASTGRQSKHDCAKITECNVSKLTRKVKPISGCGTLLVLLLLLLLLL